MNLKLYVLKRKRRKYGEIITQTYFAIVDSDNLKGYPSNFVCTLPLRAESYEPRTQYTSTFMIIIGQGSIARAMELLNEALVKENDPLIVKAIEKRLELLRQPRKETSTLI